VSDVDMRIVNETSTTIQEFDFCDLSLTVQSISVF